MSKNVVPIAIRPSAKPDKFHIDESLYCSRMIGNIAGKRIVFDFYTRVREINPVDATVLPMPAPVTPEERKSSPQSLRPETRARIDVRENRGIQQSEE